VGSGDVNYNIIDNEVERDPQTDLPMIHASGVKGALREHFTGKQMDSAVIQRIFGSAPKSKEEIKAGTYKFLDAKFLLRPMRVSGDAQRASILVTSIAALNDYLELLSAFGCNHYGIERITADASVFADAEFLTNGNGSITVEGEKTNKMPTALAEQLLKLKDILGDTFAVAKQIDRYPLPVMARNYLENGKSKNLWYEEVVPQKSVFYQLILTPDENMELDLEAEPIQFGGNGSIGCGFIRIRKLEVVHE
jgi:CRISPR-associated protein Cmr4